MKAVAENDAKDKVQFSLVLDNAFKQQHCVGSNSETVSITQNMFGRTGDSSIAIAWISIVLFDSKVLTVVVVFIEK